MRARAVVACALAVVLLFAPAMYQRRTVGRRVAFVESIGSRDRTLRGKARVRARKAETA